jgi:hypothetical protein
MCESQDPCGDYTYCAQIPDACAATPTCDCIMAQPDADTLTCQGDATKGLFVFDQLGDSPCCP